MLLIGEVRVGDLTFSQKGIDKVIKLLFRGEGGGEMLNLCVAGQGREFEDVGLELDPHTI